MSRSYNHRTRPSGRRRKTTSSRESDQQDAYRCRRCKLMVSHLALGTQHRNHCPSCLWSIHVDQNPGDRRSDCLALMEPIAIWVQPRGEWSLVHRCHGCGALNSNRIAGDDNAFVLMSLAARPVAQPPFPLAGLGGSGGSETDLDE